MEIFNNKMQKNIFCIKRTIICSLFIILFSQCFCLMGFTRDLTAVFLGENGEFAITMDEMVEEWNKNLPPEGFTPYVGPNQNLELRQSEAEFKYNVVVKEENLKTYMTRREGEKIRDGFQKGKSTIPGKNDCYFYLDGDGAVFTGYLEDLKKDIYYFAPEQGGEMLVGELPNSNGAIMFNENGALVAGREILIQNNIPIYRVESGYWIIDGKKWYYMLTDIVGRELGLIKDQVIKLYNPYTDTMETYVFDETGLMLTGNVYYRGKVYALQDYGKNIGALIPVLMDPKYTPEEYEAMFSLGIKGQ